MIVQFCFLHLVLYSFWKVTAVEWRDGFVARRFGQKLRLRHINLIKYNVQNACNGHFRQLFLLLSLLYFHNVIRYYPFIKVNYRRGEELSQWLFLLEIFFHEFIQIRVYINRCPVAKDFSIHHLKCGHWSKHLWYM